MQILYKFLKKLKSFFHMSFKDKILFFEAFMLSGIARMAMLYVPFKRLKKYMGVYKKKYTYDINEEQYKTVGRVICALNRAVRYTPWESKCLVQALTAQRMLKKRKIYSTVCLGLSKDGDNSLLAHAWLKCGEYIVTGAYEASSFKEVARFTNYCNEKEYQNA